MLIPEWMTAAPTPPYVPFFTRLWLALACLFRVLFRPSFAAQVLPVYRQVPGLPEGLLPEGQHASGLFVLGMLQREGRLIDFLEEDVAPYSDAEVGAAARVVHEGCRRVLHEYLALEPVLSEPEGAQVTVGAGFDARRIRLAGNVAGHPPFSGALRHHGWVAREVRLPPVPQALDPKVLAPAEVELL